jgi:hypothetical protein
MVALRKMLQGSGRGATDLTNKEILKSLKVTILDKALIMRSSSAEVRSQIVSCTGRAVTNWSENKTNLFFLFILHGISVLRHW